MVSAIAFVTSHRATKCFLLSVCKINGRFLSLRGLLGNTIHHLGVQPAAASRTGK